MLSAASGRNCQLTAAAARVKMIARSVDPNPGATAMIQEWFSAIELPLSWRQFWQLPQNPAYKYEYSDGRAWLSPRPKSCHAVLDLAAFRRPIAEVATDEKLVIRPLQDADWQQLPALFAAAFYRVQPFASLTDDDRLAAAQDCLDYTHGAGEGPLVGEACLVAARADDAMLLAANLITLPPDKAIEHAAGSPHLTWIFVGPSYSPGRWHGIARRGGPGVVATWIHEFGQHVFARQRVEHALALASGLQAAGTALVHADPSERSKGGAIAVPAEAEPLFRDARIFEKEDGGKENDFIFVSPIFFSQKACYSAL